MNWQVEYLPEALEDIRTLDGSQRLLVRKAIAKVSVNPLSSDEGGYGKPLGNKGTTQLSGYFKIRLRGSGLRIVYKLIRLESEMLVIVVGAREDDEVYEEADRRIQHNHL